MVLRNWQVVIDQTGVEVCATCTARDVLDATNKNCYKYLMSH